MTSTTAPARTRRDPSVDVARAWCLVIVVALHALMVGVSVADGAPALENAMDGWSGFAALTWVVQVMPLFFVLGGFSSATQWERLRDRGVPAHRYAAMRLRRLLPPALGAMVATAAVMLALMLARVPDDVVAVAGFRMSQPLWFLAVYLLCSGLIPLMVALHRAAPRTVLATLALLIVAIDVARIGTGVTAIGFANLLFVWLFVQQLGINLASADRARTRTPKATLITVAAGSFAVLAMLCTSGVYSPDLYENLNPPTVALMLLGVAQLCLFELARPLLRRVHAARPIAAAVAAVNARAMTIYSWHMLVLIGLAGIMLVSYGDALPTPLSPEWWAIRPGWLAIVAAAVIVVAAIAGRHEAGPARARARRIRRVEATRAIAARPAAWRRSLAQRTPHPVTAPAALIASAGGVLAVLLAGSSPSAWFVGSVVLAAAFLVARHVDTHGMHGMHSTA